MSTFLSSVAYLQPNLSMDFIRSGKVFGQRGAKNKENKQPASKPIKDSVICLDETVLDIINDSFGGQEKASGKGKAKKPQTPKSEFSIRKENASTPKTPGSANRGEANELVSKSSKGKIGRPRKLTAHCSSPILTNKPQKTKVAPVFKTPQVVKPSQASKTVSPIKLRKAKGSIWEQEQPDARPSISSTLTSISSTLTSTSSTLTSTSSAASITSSAPLFTVRSCNCLTKCHATTCSCRFNFYKKISTESWKKLFAGLATSPAVLIAAAPQAPQPA